MDSNDSENILMYNTLFDKKIKYITFSNLNHIFFYDKKYVNILKIGNKYNIYVCLKNNKNNEFLKYIQAYVAIIISDILVINKVSNIKQGIYELDIALDLGKEIYAIPGDIFKPEKYLANFAIKQGAIPICNKYDINYILKEF